jgi:phosphate transport system substrate-binding protein
MVYSVFIDLFQEQEMLKAELILFSLFIFLTGCGTDASKSGAQDTATYGEINIAADEAYSPIIEAELDVFKAFYKYAIIHSKYGSEGEAFNLLLKDSVRLIVATRELSIEEKAVFDRIKIIPRVNKIAQDGIALIVNIGSKDTLVTMKELKEVFSGNSKKYSRIVFDNSNSSNLRFIKEKFNLSTLPGIIFSAGSNRAVLDYIKGDKSALGVIGCNWISDSDDSTSRSFMRSVQVVSIADVEKPVYPDDYFQPYQAYIATGQYPLSRDLFIISREARVGLGTGFASFVTGDQGQRIILKSGLVPATVPLRIVKTTKDQP